MEKLNTLILITLIGLTLSLLLTIIIAKIESNTLMKKNKGLYKGQIFYTGDENPFLRYEIIILEIMDGYNLW